ERRKAASTIQAAQHGDSSARCVYPFIPVDIPGGAALSVSRVTAYPIGEQGIHEAKEIFIAVLGPGDIVAEIEKIRSAVEGEMPCIHGPRQRYFRPEARSLGAPSRGETVAVL